MRGVIAVNEEQRARMVEKVMRGLTKLGLGETQTSGDQTARPFRVAVWGLTFKAGTDDLRESPALAIISELQRHGCEINGYDPTVPVEVSDFRSEVLSGIHIAGSALEAVVDADLLMVATEWPELCTVDMGAVAAAMRGKMVVDTRNLLDPSQVRGAGLEYEGVGRR